MSPESSQIYDTAAQKKNFGRRSQFGSHQPLPSEVIWNNFISQNYPVLPKCEVIYKKLKIAYLNSHSIVSREGGKNSCLRRSQAGWVLRTKLSEKKQRKVDMLKPDPWRHKNSFKIFQQLLWGEEIKLFQMTSEGRG